MYINIKRSFSLSMLLLNGVKPKQGVFAFVQSSLNDDNINKHYRKMTLSQTLACHCHSETQAPLL